MFVMRKSGKVQFLVIVGVVVAKNQRLGCAHILVGIHQSVYGDLNIHKLPQVKNLAIHEVELTADETFIRSSLVVGNIG